MKQLMRFAGLCMAVAGLCALVATAGCGGSDSSDASAQNSAEPAIPTSPPKIDVPEGLPPKKLVVKNLRKGTGAEAKKGDEVELHYYGVQWNGGIEHSNSWRYANVPRFELGSHRLLRGLNRAIPGMKEGGSREVIIPYDLIYYPGGNHRPLGPLDALIYKVYLVKVLK
jgi:peptidylprolyl isomerase